MIDIATQIDAIHRRVATRSAAEGEQVAVVLRRTYDAAIEDVWDAITDPIRIQRWFLPLSGDLREGGDFQLAGNAGGRILGCERPHRLRLTFGGDFSLVEVRLTADDAETTTLELEHTVPIEMAGSGAGALYVGPGWDGAFLALGLFLDGVVAEDPRAAAVSPEAIAFSRASIAAWTRTIEGSGTATGEEIAGAVEASLAQFAPPDVGPTDGRAPAAP